MEGKTDLKQKIALILLGILITLVLLELGLRLGGFLFTLNQNRTNHVYFKNNEIRILCVGESTTALGGSNSYPAQLEEILRERNPGKEIHVINAGQVSKASWHLLEDIEENVEKYRPHIVITMIGINDFSFGDPENHLVFRINNFFLRSRVFKLFRLLQHHIQERMRPHVDQPMLLQKKHHAFSDSIEENLAKEYDIRDINEKQQLHALLEETQAKLFKLKNYYEATHQLNDPEKKEQLDQLNMRKTIILCRLGNFYYVRKEYTKAKWCFNEAISSGTNFYVAYLQLGKVYMEEKKFAKARDLIEKSSSLRPQSILVRMELARCYAQMGNKERARQIFKEILKKGPDNVWFFSEIAKWFKTNGYYDEAEQIYLKAIEENSGDYEAYDELAGIYLQRGESEKAKQIYQKAKNRAGTIPLYSPLTTYYYNQIAEAVLSHDVKLICMQYPLRSIDSLKSAVRFRDQVIFVENKKNFEEVLKKDQYSKYFLDNFAGDFGHCTHAGNRLIAQRLADVIEKEIILENKL